MTEGSERPPMLQALARRVALVLQEAGSGFLANQDLRQASGLAFYTTLAIIPALLLLTFLLGLVLGGSLPAQQKITDHLASILPGKADGVLKELAALTRNHPSAGALNVLVLAWSVTPLISALRQAIRGIFKDWEPRAVWIITRLLDMAVGMLALTSLAAAAAAGVLLHVINTSLAGAAAPRSPGFFLPFVVATVMVVGILALFAPRGVRPGHLLAGALATTVLWFLLRPAFTLFLTYDRNYGLAFGSFKSMFVVVIWIYVSMAILLLGAEVAAACHRREAAAIRRLMDGRWRPGAAGHAELLLEAPAGHVFFREGEPADEMYFVLGGSVTIRKGDLELARIGPGNFFGEMSFLLGSDRTAGAVALAPCRCVRIHARNFDQLSREYPDTVRMMLVEMAARLRATSELARGGPATPREADEIIAVP